MPGQLITNAQNEEMVRRLVDAGARFLLIGGLAVHYHVPKRELKGRDIDLLIEPTSDTARKIIGVLDSEPGLAHAITVEQLCRPKALIQLKTYHDMDLQTPRADVNFAEHFDQAVETFLGGRPIKVASIETLLLLLSHSALPKHLRDIELLKDAQQRSGCKQ
jgi:predicted nucleotidyltransferase